jgi:hypothetical protein
MEPLILQRFDGNVIRQNLQLCYLAFVVHLAFAVDGNRLFAA